MKGYAPKIITDITFNAKEKIYPNGYRHITAASRSIFREPGWEPIGKSIDDKMPKPQNKDTEVRDDSVRRAKTKIFDIAMLNDFDYFFTGTLDSSVIERDNPEAVSKAIKTFFKNMVCRYDVSYLLVPEYHKDGKNIHVHGFIKGNLSLVDSGKRTKDGKIIYNWLDWKFGFTTVIPLTGDKLHAAKYITKYISKDFKKIFGNFYYAGGPIVRKPQIRYYDIDFDSIDAKEYMAPNANVVFKYLSIDAESLE